MKFITYDNDAGGLYLQLTPYYHKREFHVEMIFGNKTLWTYSRYYHWRGSGRFNLREPETTLMILRFGAEHGDLIRARAWELIA